MKLTILGATGSGGRELVKHALAANHTVTILARHPEKLETLLQVQPGFLSGLVAAIAVALL